MVGKNACRGLRFRIAPIGRPAQPVRQRAVCRDSAGGDGSEMTVCGACGCEFDERAFLVIVHGVKGSFHSLDCAAEGYERFLQRGHLSPTYGADASVEPMIRGWDGIDRFARRQRARETPRQSC